MTPIRDRCGGRANAAFDLAGAPPRVLAQWGMEARRPKPLSFGRRLTVYGLGLCLFASALSACDTSCADEGQTPILYSDGFVEEAEGGRVYMTTPYDGTWLHFPSQRRFRLTHNLGTRSYTFSTYVSFHPTPLPEDGDIHGLTEAAGNEVVFEALTEQYVQVRNDTCSEFYLLVRLVAGSPAGREDGAAGAAGS